MGGLLTTLMKNLLTLALLSSVILTACQSAPSADSQSSATAVVEAFYGAMVAGDTGLALQYVAPAVVDTEDFQSTWDEVSGWTWNSVTVQSVDGSEVTIEMSITVEGEEDSGTDQVEVTEKDGKWWITDLPS